MVTSTETAWLPFLLQTGDALFPTGAYAHSAGLEEMVRLGAVSDAAGLGAYLEEQVVPVLRELELPYLRAAFAAAETGDWAELLRIDAEIHAWRLPAELRAASCQLGERRLQMLAKLGDFPVVARLLAAIADGSAHGHQLTALAAQGVAGGVPLRAVLLSHVYATFATACSAALKLIRIGQEGAQRILRQALSGAEKVVEESLAIPREAAGAFSPLLEIAALRHARAWERLFIS